MKWQPKTPAWQWRAWDRKGIRIIARGRTLHDAMTAAIKAGEPYPLLEQRSQSEQASPQRSYWKRTI